MIIRRDAREITMFVYATEKPKETVTLAARHVTKTLWILGANSSPWRYLLALELCTSVHGQTIVVARVARRVVGCATSIIQIAPVTFSTFARSVPLSLFTFRMIASSAARLT